jgi:hypothetical protein
MKIRKTGDWKEKNKCLERGNYHFAPIFKKGCKYLG